MARKKVANESTTLGMPFYVKLGPNLRAASLSGAKREGRTMNEVIRRLLTVWVNSGKPSPDPPSSPG